MKEIILTLALIGMSANHSFGLTIQPVQEEWKDVKAPSWGLSFDSIEVLGFSKDAKIAFVYKDSRSACGDCPELRIVDLKNDNQLEELTELSGRAPVEREKVLKKHAIDLRKNFTFTKFPASLLRDTFQLEIGGGGVFLNSAKGGKKRLGTLKEEKNTKEPTFSKARALGIIKSPFEDRGLVFIAYPANVFEDTDPITVIKLTYFWAHLTDGFKHE